METFLYVFKILKRHNLSVLVTIHAGPPGPEVKTLPKHKKNPDVGAKKTVYSSNILIDQEDALSFGDREEVRLNVSAFEMTARAQT